MALAAGSLAGCAADDTTTPVGTSCGGEELPEQVCCSEDGTVCEIAAPLSNPITRSFEMIPGVSWLLKGGVFIGDDTNETVLTIRPGTTIYGETSSKAFLTIRRGSKIVAEGTKEAPIVFTSSKPAGERARGDWGGVVLNGRAPINGCSAGGVCEAEGEGATGKYGGDSAGDSTGTLRYVRVEFAGHPITPDNELNGIAFQGVGSGTTVEYVQVHMAADDGIEFFGGTASFKYVLTTGISDDNLDWTDGWQGKGQFFIAQQYEDAGDNGIEADNNADNNGATPTSQPTLSNLTLIGVPDSEKSDLGMLLREGTGANIYNSVVLGWNDACADIDHAATFAGAWDGTILTGDLTVAASVFSCATPFKENNEMGADESPIDDPWSVEMFFTSWNEGNTVADPGLTSPFDTASPDLRPGSGSMLTTGAMMPPNDAWFTPVTFRGGVDPDDDWTRGWTTAARN